MRLLCGCFGAFFPPINSNSPASNIKFLFEVLENIITWQVECIHIAFFYFNRKIASQYCLSFIHSDTGLLFMCSSGFSALAEDSLTHGQREKAIKLLTLRYLDELLYLLSHLFSPPTLTHSGRTNIQCNSNAYLLRIRNYLALKMTFVVAKLCNNNIN